GTAAEDNDGAMHGYLNLPTTAVPTRITTPPTARIVPTTFGTIWFISGERNPPTMRFSLNGFQRYGRSQAATAPTRQREPMPSCSTICWSIADGTRSVPATYRAKNSTTMFTSTGKLKSPGPGRPTIVARSVSESNVIQSGVC